jgi:hypothetical protein
MFSLFCLDYTKLNKYIGYKKIKSYVIKDVNYFSLVKNFIGDGVMYFYDNEVVVNNDILKEISVDGGYYIYQSSSILYSTMIGSVSEIKKGEEYYTVFVNTLDGRVMLFGLEEVYVSLYQKIEANTMIGSLYYSKDGYYYFYKKV